MKRIILSLAVILAAGFTQISAQSVTSGVKADLNISNFILKDLDHMDSKMKVGASLGGFVKIEFTQNFAIQPELLFHFKSSEIKNNSTRPKTKSDYEYWGMEIPVYAVGQMQLGLGTGYVGIGPYVGLGFSAKSSPGSSDLYKRDVLQRWDFGFGAMLGYEFDFGLQINAGYKIGVINAMDEGSDDAKMLPQMISVGFGYRF
ncbi:MAG: PorT family protein [Bacteroidales bacterium]|jgi:hypothetical protein|nr:PorT family protein [Bacteroidales bacterium]